MLPRNLFLGILFSSLAIAAAAQAGSSGTGGDGTEIYGYQTQQNIELGYRFTDLTGSDQIYNTFINQQEGLRVLSQSLTMRSMQQTGSLFDDLEASSFGWGGDPENVARLRISKYHWYDFTALFRRDKNYWDYNLFANPLNPSTATPNVPVDFSPHSMFTTRRMYDYGLSILPQSRFTVRLGYSRNRSEGPSFSSIHEGTDALLNQGWNFTSDEYRVGFDMKFVPRTTISFDQLVSFDRNDTDYTLNPYNSFPLTGGPPVVFGLPWSPLQGSPCATPLLPDGTANPACNGYFSYNRTQRVRTTTPTEQLSLSSTYFRKLNIVAHATYSSGTLDTPYNEIFTGLVTRTGERQIVVTGPASVRRVAVTTDVGATYELAGWLRLNGSFRIDNWRLPGSWNSLTASTVGVTSSLLSPFGTTTITPALILDFYGQKSYQPQIVLEAGSRRIGGHFGYRFHHRHIFKAAPETVDPVLGFQPFDGDSFDINDHTALAGVWFRPVDALRINFDAELSTADNFLTRISPRQWQSYRGRVNYKAANWANVALSVDDNESRNGESDTNFKQHYRNAGFVMTLMPSDRFNVDLAYNYTDALQDAFICYSGTVLAPGTIPLGCPTYDPTAVADNPNPNWLYSTYNNQTHYFHGDVMFSPTKRLHTSLGYGLTKTDGSTSILNPLQPFGPLQFTYHQPTGSISYDVAKNFSLNAYWNYDQYNEASFVGPTLPRYFHDNRTVRSAKYAF